MIAILAAAPRGVAHMLPVGGPVAGGGEAVALDEGLQPLETVAVLGPPVRVNAAGHRAEQVTGQMRNAHPGQDQKARVVGQLRQPLAPLRVDPTQKPVSRRTAPRGRPEQQTTQIPPLRIARQIAEVLADHVQAEIMIPLQIEGPASGDGRTRGDPLQLDRLQR